MRLFNFHVKIVSRIEAKCRLGVRFMFDIFHTIFKFKEKESPDKLGYYPERVHINAMPERRYLWTSRVLVILASLSICINMMLASTIYVLLPQRRATPQLFYINKYFSQMEQVQPAEVNMPVGDLIAEQHINDYIMLRYLISSDYDELLSRWGEGSTIYWYSASNVYGDFAKNDAEYNIMQFREKGLRRDVEIDWTRPLAQGLWMVQFRTLDYLPENDKPIENTWRATLRIGFTNIPFRNKEDAIANPFGFLVTSFSLAYHGSPNKIQNYLQTVKRATQSNFK